MSARRHNIFSLHRLNSTKYLNFRMILLLEIKKFFLFSFSRFGISIHFKDEEERLQIHLCH